MYIPLFKRMKGTQFTKYTFTKYCTLCYIYSTKYNSVLCNIKCNFNKVNFKENFKCMIT